MKVSLLGHFDEDHDEGVRIIGRELARQLDLAGIEVLTIDITRRDRWREIRKFQPDILHFVMSPTVAGLLAARLISLLNPKAKTVISAVHPYIPGWRILKWLRPDITLIQSFKSEMLFESVGFRSTFFPNGVDYTRFSPLLPEEKQKLKETYEFGEDDFIVLHLASLKEERNLGVFSSLQRSKNCQVLIIGREGENYDRGAVDELQDAGCKVWIKHFPNIEEIYKMADCYIFPTIEQTACIEAPLSVMEAMACNLPVITTPFGSLPWLFSEGDGLFFIESDEEIYHVLDLLQRRIITVKTREKVFPYSWDVIIPRLEEIYVSLLR